MDDRLAYVALNLMEGVGPVSVAALAAAVGSPRALFEAGENDIRRVRGVSREVADKLLAQRDRVDPAAELAAAGERGIAIVTAADADYPDRLRGLHSPPLVLYVWGATRETDAQAVAVVGTRRASHYGRECAERLAYGLSQGGLAVVSGLARGIDTAAHAGALRAKGRTLAVLGGGLDSIYPRENRGLAREIAEAGAVISEYPFGRQPDRATFPARNRIVAGLSLAVLVVEAGVRSGALNTADHALEQGKAVLAVPGRIDSPGSRGTHELIRSGARLVESVEDVLDELQNLFPRPAPRAGPGGGPVLRLSEEEQRITNLLEDGELDVDEIIRRSGLKPQTVSSSLIALEMKKAVRLLPGRIAELRRQ